jgi:hypothetical protein
MTVSCNFIVTIPSNRNNCKFDLYKNKKNIGGIVFHIEYNQITISWLFINSDIQRQGYGSIMIKMFEKYLSKSHKSINKIVLIPEYFNGNIKNKLCIFYEKNGFFQERDGYPSYIKKI